MGGEGPNWNSNPEQNPEQNQEQTHEEHQNRGAGVLSEISFADAKREGEVPEGVRDEKDAKLNEARDFILENYSKDPDYIEDVKDLANLEELKTIVEHGFSLEELCKNGLIATHGESYDPLDALEDTENFVKGLAIFCDTCDGRSEDINEMHGVFEAWRKNDLDPEQYIFIKQLAPKNYGLYERLMFGGSINNRINSYEEHITKLLQELPEIAKICSTRFMDGNDGAKILMDIYNWLGISVRYGRADEDTYNRIRSKFAESASRMVWAIVDELRDHYSSSRDYAVGQLKDIVKGVLRPHDDNVIKMAKNATLRDVNKDFEEIEIPAFSDEELIGAIYSLKNSEEVEKFGEGWQDIDYKLGRNIGRLEKLGFSRESLLKIMRKNDVHVGTEEIEDMREDGLNDTEIAYAANACKWGFCSPNGERHWINEDFKVFSDTDLLNAALMANYDD